MNVVVVESPAKAKTVGRYGMRARAAPDLVERDFTADAPDRLWVAD